MCLIQQSVLIILDNSVNRLFRRACIRDVYSDFIVGRYGVVHIIGELSHFFNKALGKSSREIFTDLLFKNSRRRMNPEKLLDVSEQLRASVLYLILYGGNALFYSVHNSVNNVFSYVKRRLYRLFYIADYAVKSLPHFCFKILYPVKNLSAQVLKALNPSFCSVCYRKTYLDNHSCNCVDNQRYHFLGCRSDLKKYLNNRSDKFGYSFHKSRYKLADYLGQFFKENRQRIDKPVRKTRYNRNSRVYQHINIIYKHFRNA